MSETASAREHFDDCLISVGKACCPTPDDRKQRQQLLDRIEGAVQACSHWLLEGTVVPYGSYVSGFYNSGSDMDVAVAGEVNVNFLTKGSLNRMYEEGHFGDTIPLHQLDKATKGQVLRKLVNKLMDHHVTRRDTLQYILHARVPIVKFKDSRTGIQVDLSLGGDGQHIKAATFKLLGQINPRFIQLYAVVKQWAKAHRINDGTIGMFNSHCLALLVIFYLQVERQLLPPIYRLFYGNRPADQAARLLQSTEPGVADQALLIAQSRLRGAQAEYSGKSSGVGLAEELQGFVHYYRGLIRRVLLEPNKGLRLSTWYGELLTGPSPLFDYTLVVEEPLNSGDNPARTFGKKGEFPWNLHYVLNVLERTATVLDHTLQAPQASSHAALVFLFGPAALVSPPLNSPLLTVFGQGWADWCNRALATQGQTEGSVMQTMLSQLGASVQAWLPDVAREGPIEWKHALLKRAEQHVKTVRRSGAQQPHREGLQAAVSAVMGDASGVQLDNFALDALQRVLDLRDLPSFAQEHYYNTQTTKLVTDLAGAIAAVVYALAHAKHRVAQLERKAQSKAAAKEPRSQSMGPQSSVGGIAVPPSAASAPAATLEMAASAAAAASSGLMSSGGGRSGGGHSSSSGGGAGLQQAGYSTEQRAPLTLADVAHVKQRPRPRDDRRARGPAAGSHAGGSSGGGTDRVHLPDTLDDQFSGLRVGIAVLQQP